jgi:ribonuclease BN (tRNA processing enzyme)
MTYNFKIQVERFQYGVGQGCFHIQELTFLAQNSPIQDKFFRFVYDCGGDTSQETLDWCIDHATGSDSKSKYVINAFFISHFEYDHINGLSKLANSDNIKINRIYAPYIGIKNVCHILGQIYLSSTGDYEDFLKVVIGLSKNESIFGIPVTLIQPSDEQSTFDSVNENDPDRDIDIFEDTLRKDSENEVIKSGVYKFKLGKVDIWELVHWSYNQDSDKNISEILMKTLSELSFIKTDPKVTSYTLEDSKTAFEVFVEKNTAEYILFCFDQNRRSIVNAYKKALANANISPSNQHNAVSLCLYSGPSDNLGNHYSIETNYSNNLTQTLTQILFNNPRIINWEWLHHDYPGVEYLSYAFPYHSWMGTGDALLGNKKIFTEFNTYFGDRIDRYNTILVPHHGAGAETSNNFTPKLLSNPFINCVISHGTKNRYRHPHKNVIKQILARNGFLISVTESNPLGLIEYLEYHCLLN